MTDAYDYEQLRAEAVILAELLDANARLPAPERRDMRTVVNRACALTALGIEAWEVLRATSRLRPQ